MQNKKIRTTNLLTVIYNSFGYCFLVVMIIFSFFYKNEAKKVLKLITIKPIKNHSATVIFLHGLGDSANNWEKNFRPIAENYPQIKFIIPKAPWIFISMNWGLPMPAWYNIKGNINDIENLKQDKTGLMKTVEQINQIIFTEINSGISAERIIVMGFSQGASVALALGLTSEFQLAGIVSLSGFLPCREGIFKEAKIKSKQIPFFLYHNYYDNVVPAWVGEKSAELLKEKCYQVEFEGYYSGDHFFRFEEFQKIITESLNKILK